MSEIGDKLIEQATGGEFKTMADFRVSLNERSGRAMAEKGILSFGQVNEAGEPLNREAFDHAVNKIARQPSRPDFLITSQRTIDAGRAAGDAACAIAMWAHRELAALPWWRWLRRRYLERTFNERAKHAESFWATFGVRDDARV